MSEATIACRTRFGPLRWSPTPRSRSREDRRPAGTGAGAREPCCDGVRSRPETSSRRPGLRHQGGRAWPREYGRVSARGIPRKRNPDDFGLVAALSEVVGQPPRKELGSALYERRLTRDDGNFHASSFWTTPSQESPSPATAPHRLHRAPPLVGGGRRDCPLPLQGFGIRFDDQAGPPCSTSSSVPPESVHVITGLRAA